MSKLSKRKRYIVKYNGPDAIKNKKCYNWAKSHMGHGDNMTRFINTVYKCRFNGFYPSTDAELARMSGTIGGKLF